MSVFLRHIPTRLRRVASTEGGVYHGPCPWCGGEDRFDVKPNAGESGLWYCHQCERGGDGIDFLRQYQGLSFVEACEAFGLSHKVQVPNGAPKSYQSYRSPSERAKPVEITAPPAPAWRDRAWSFAEECAARLWTDEGARALDWLRGRGLVDDAIRAASLGYNPADVYEKPEAWGLERDKDVWLPRGITIPWVIAGEIWRVNIRRPAGDPKYYGPPGYSNGLYQADRIMPDRPAVLVEGEIDAWTVLQCAGDIAAAVATGSTSGSRKTKWVARLTLASVVLVAFDVDDAGEHAAEYWLEALPNARRWRPYWNDVNTMLQDGADVRAWVAAGLN